MRRIQQRNADHDYQGDGGGPWRITFDTNPDDCNMYCIMCEEHSEFSPLRRDRISSGRPHRRMDIEIIRNTVSEMSTHGLREIIPSTMGEPLLYEDFQEILNICGMYNIKLNLTTNGTWPGLGPEKWARMICPVASDVKVSWNGVSREVQEGIMKGSRLDRRISDLKRFINVRDEIAEQGVNRCSITLQATFLEMNLSELPDLIRLSIELGIDRVKGHQLWVHFPEIRGLDMRRSYDTIQRWNETVETCMKIAEQFRRSDGSKIILDNFNYLNSEDHGSMPPNWECPFLGKEAWVNHEGRFDPCCAPDAERMKLGYFGNIKDGGLLSIWEGHMYKDLKYSYMDNRVCRKCTMRKPGTGVNST